MRQNQERKLQLLIHNPMGAVRRSADSGAADTHVLLHAHFQKVFNTNSKHHNYCMPQIICVYAYK
ncbi:hypothetical protein [Mucilaginibacter polytrichastri]|nr:hypothetical protein [Mucilaginibacter polytrichastri]